MSELTDRFQGLTVLVDVYVVVKRPRRQMERLRYRLRARILEIQKALHYNWDFRGYLNT